MLSDEFNQMADHIEASTDDPQTKAIVLVARTLNEVNWNLTYLKKQQEKLTRKVERIADVMYDKEYNSHDEDSDDSPNNWS